ncbi:MAG: glycosyltransferase, partial [Solirubrobacteraceae bacterium]
MTLLKTAFWTSAGLLVYTHAGYPAALAALDRLRGARGDAGADGPVDDASLPGVSVIVAAYAEQDVIAARVANLLALDYPRDKLEVIVACDGSPDATAQRARDAGADLVLELPRGGKVRTQDAAVGQARHAITAFSDANVSW